MKVSKSLVNAINADLEGQGYRLVLDQNMEGTNSHIIIQNESGDEKLFTSPNITEALLAIGRSLTVEPKAEPDGRETVNLTPAAFLPSNPKAQENIAKANKAAKAMDDALRGKVQYLDELVRVHFGGTDNMLWALIKVMERDGMGSVQGRLDLTAVVKEYTEWDNAHTKAGNDIRDALGGR